MNTNNAVVHPEYTHARREVSRQDPGSSSSPPSSPPGSHSIGPAIAPFCSRHARGGGRGGRGGREGGKERALCYVTSCSLAGASATRPSGRSMKRQDASMPSGQAGARRGGGAGRTWGGTAVACRIRHSTGPSDSTLLFDAHEGFPITEARHMSTAMKRQERRYYQGVWGVRGGG